MYKKDCNTPATCVLCLDSHPVNYKSREVYKEILGSRILQLLEIQI